MTTSLEVLFVQALSGLAIALVTAWITVRLSLRRFRAEKQWERKAIAYERLIEAFHKSKKFSSEHLDSTYKGRELAEERDKELRALAKEAREEIRRAADIGGLTLSDEAQKILSSYEAELESTDSITTWHDHLEHDYSVTNKCLQALLAEAKRDLAK
jgi:hypothetical protein